MRHLILGIAGASALAFASTAANASVTLGSFGSSCTTGGCTAGTSTASVTDNLGNPNKVEFDDTNASSGTQIAWFNFLVTPDGLGAFSAITATNPASPVTLLQIFSGGTQTTAGTTLVTSSPGTQLNYGTLTANTWYTFQYTANMASGGGNISGTASIYAAVPEPATWGLMLIGFAGIGMAMRRRRRGTALAQIA